MLCQVPLIKRVLRASEYMQEVLVMLLWSRQSLYFSRLLFIVVPIFLFYFICYKKYFHGSTCYSVRFMMVGTYYV